MRRLALRHDCLSNPTRADLGALEVEMLWPHDETKRREALDAIAGELIVDNLTALPSNTAEMQEAMRLMLSLPRLPDAQQAGKEAYVHGIIAGKLLRDAIWFAQHEPAKANMEQIKKDAAKRLGSGRGVRLSVKTINNTVWKRYRPVAHLWAAHIEMSAENQGRYVFPCTTADLELFLSISEYYRETGLATHLKHAPSSILTLDNTIQLPADMVLERWAISSREN